MILHRYFALRFLRSFGVTFFLFFAMMALVELIENSRRFGSQGVVFADLLGITLLNIPQAIYEILPLIVIIATVALFLALARSSELVVTRAAGRSALRALLAPVLMTLLLGAAAIAVMNPIVAATSKQYEARVGDLSGVSNVLTLSQDGLWLRQGGEAGQTVIRAVGANLDGTLLSGVTMITFNPDGSPRRRIEARTAELREGTWAMVEAKVWPLGVQNPEAAAEVHPALQIGSTLTADQIRDSFGTPASIPIWELPAFIERLQAAGFTARRHQVFLHTELAMPLFLTAMVLIGAAFTMRQQRGGRTRVMVLTAIMLSFGVYFLRNFARVLGESGQVAPALAAWAPPAAAIGLALALILHLEDG